MCDLLLPPLTSSYLLPPIVALLYIFYNIALALIPTSVYVITLILHVYVYIYIYIYIVPYVSVGHV